MTANLPQAPDPPIEYASPASRQAVPLDRYVFAGGVIAEPPGRFWRALRQIGPGLILAGAIVGTGELIATTHLGAKAGFALLWLVIVSCFIKVFVQIELGRYAISEGRTTMAALADVPVVGRVFGLWWILMMLATQLQLGAMVGGVGQALHLAMPQLSAALGATARPELPWALLTAISASVILAIGSYGVVEKFSTLLVVLFTSATVLCVFLLPAAGHPIPWDEVGQGLLFTIPSGAIVAAVAMFGITGVGAAELVAYPYWCIEKGYASKTGPRDESSDWVRRARGWLRVMRLDAWFSMVVYTIATIAFFFLGATVLKDRRGEGLPSTVGAMLDELSRMYTPVLGRVIGAGPAMWFIVAGVVAVLYSTLFASTGANSRALVDFLNVNRVVDLSAPRARLNWVRAFCVLFPILDLGLFLVIGNPVMMVLIGGFAQALTLPMLAGSAVYLRYRRTDPRLRPTIRWDIFLWLSLLGLCAAAAVGLFDNIVKLLNTFSRQ